MWRRVLQPGTFASRPVRTGHTLLRALCAFSVSSVDFLIAIRISKENLTARRCFYFQFSNFHFRISYARGARFGVNTSRSSRAASSPVASSFLVISVPYVRAMHSNTHSLVKIGIDRSGVRS